MKRIVVTLSVPGELTIHDVTDYIDCAFPNSQGWAGDVDATAWEWTDFWHDVEDGIVTSDGDGTSSTHWPPGTAYVIKGLREIVDDLA